MNVELLIQLAYKYGQIIAEDGEVVDSNQVSTGLTLLNIIIEEINITSDHRPLLSEETVNMTQGDEDVILTDWVSIIKAQYLIGTVVYSLQLTNLESYLNRRTITQTNGIPFIAYPQRTDTGITLRLFFKPSQAYELTVTGYKNLPTFEVGDTLSGVSTFMQNYYIFRLAQDLRRFHQKEFDPYLAERVAKFEKEFMRIRETFMNIETPLLGKKGRSDNSGQLNLGRGYFP